MNRPHVGLQIRVHIGINEVVEDVVTADEFHGLDVVVTARMTRIVDVSISSGIMVDSGHVPIHTVSSEYCRSIVGKFLKEEYWIICNNLIVGHEHMAFKNIRVDDSRVPLQVVAVPPECEMGDYIIAA